MSEQANTKRVAKNTLMLYFRQILIMAVSLYTVRVVLNTLGAEDYGIYNVVAGCVTMFNFLGHSMTSASQRYFSFDLGKEDKEHLKVTFCVTFEIYLLLAVIIVVIAETFGLWFINNKLVIPSERLIAANWIFQAAIISFLMTLITTPYMALIIAHEKMNIYAYASIIEAILKLAIVFLLKIILYDKLIVYGILLAIVAFINTSVYRLYCHKRYTECKIHFIKEWTLLREILEYSGWNLFGSIATVVKKQVLNILLNIFYGPIISASRSIASQVNTTITNFANNFSTALRPQIVKTYARDQKEESLNLVYRGCKFTFFLMYVFILPLVIEMEIVLNLWLKTPPEQVVIFTRLALIESLILSISYPIMSLAHASGKIRLYQGVVGGSLLMNLPVSWISLKFGAPAYSVMVITVVIEIIAFVLRLLIIHKITGMSIRQYTINVIIPVLLVALLSTVVPLFIYHFMNQSIIRLLFIILTSFIGIISFAFIIGMNKNERRLLRKYLKGKFSK